MSFKHRARPIILLLALLLVPSVGHARVKRVKQTHGPNVSPTEWLGAMEASLATARDIDSSTSLSSSSVLTTPALLGLAGWLTAFACFAAFLVMSAKIRRREKLLERGSKPDIFLYTPKRK